MHSNTARCQQCSLFMHPQKTALCALQITAAASVFPRMHEGGCSVYTCCARMLQLEGEDLKLAHMYACIALSAYENEKAKVRTLCQRP